MRTIHELMDKIWEVCPDATMGEDNSGQLIIYTDVILADDDLIPLNLKE